jgi:arylsulfatase A-like enzyme
MNPTRPNILLVTTDTSRWDTLGCYGSEHAVSPHLDRLAEEGVLFEQAHTNATVCMPARCSILTGTHTPVHGCLENGIDPIAGLTPFTDLLAEAGYTNIMVGKTHFGAIPDSFHVQRILAGEKGKDVEDFYAEHLRAHGYSRATQFPNPVPEELFCEAFLVDTTIAEIETFRSENADSGSPFFAFCSMLSPHGPLDPPGRWASLFDDRELPEINYRPGEVAELPPHVRRHLGLLGREDDLPYFPGGLPDAAGIDARRRLYYGLAAYCDDQVGRLLRYLDETGLRSNTLVIFTSDHGQQYFDHGFDNKHTFYEASWRVPMIISMPGTLPEGLRQQFAMSTDVTATILAAAGQDLATVQGYDLLDPLSRGQDAPRRCAVSVLYKSLALVTSRWKLEYYTEDGLGRLFDRQEDPLEQVDLYGDDDYRDVREALLEALLSWRADLSDVQQMQARTSTGGPVAVRVAAETMEMRGTDSEVRLDRRVEEIDVRFGSAWAPAVSLAT